MPTPKVNSWLGWRNFTVNRASVRPILAQTPGLVSWTSIESLFWKSNFETRFELFVSLTSEVGNTETASDRLPPEEWAFFTQMSPGDIIREDLTRGNEPFYFLLHWSATASTIHRANGMFNLPSSSVSWTEGRWNMLMVETRNELRSASVRTTCIHVTTGIP
jgi:hypothetical protein